MYVPLSDDKHQFVQKIHPTCANGHWERGHNSNPVATLPHAAVVFRMQPFNQRRQDPDHRWRKCSKGGALIATVAFMLELELLILTM